MSQSSNIGFLSIAMSSLHSNGLHIQQVEQKIHIVDVLCDVIEEQRTKAALKVKRVSTLHIFFHVVIISLPPPQRWLSNQLKLL